MITVLAFIVVLGVLVFVHEMGHFLAAKAFKIRVDRFSMGFPPRLVGKQVGETDYCISAVPFGGYVKIAGMVDENFDTESLEGPPQPWEFRARPWYQKAVVVSAGAMMNLLLAILIFWGIAQYQGKSIWNGRVEVMPDSPAAQAGLLTGDQIQSVSGEKVDDWVRLVEIIQPSAEEPLRFEVLRSDSIIRFTVIPELSRNMTASGDSAYVGIAGIRPVVDREKLNPVQALGQGVALSASLTKEFLVVIKKLVSGKESIKALAGPVYIAKVAGDSARQGPGELIVLIAFLSINLGILNMLPLPVLDGGHLVFITVESVFRRTIPIKIKLAIQQAGMVLLLGLMLFVVYNDILRLIHK